MNGQKITIDALQSLAASLGGKCLTEVYKPRIKLKWQCFYNHIWEARADQVKSGSWCPYCRKRKYYSLAEINILVSNKGTCKSDTDVITQNSDLKWNCSNGHEWIGKLRYVLAGHWCLQCSYLDRLKSIEYFIELANARGGKLLSQKYFGIKHKYKWQCYYGHEWETTAATIDNGCWCPECSTGLSERICRQYFEQIFKEKFIRCKPSWLIHDGVKLELDGYCEILKLAFEHNGEQHYRVNGKFTKDETSLIKRKKYDLAKIDICNKFGVKLIVIPPLFTELRVTDLKQFIINECLKQKVDLPNNLEVDISLKSVYIDNILDELNAIAVEKGGRCLSSMYLGSNVKLEWECSKNHRWWAVPYSIKQGVWCWECHRNADVKLKVLKDIALSKGGSCLAEVYINCREKIGWKCYKGHEWKADARHIMAGTWCPVCAKKLP